MTSKTSHPNASLLPHQIKALGAQGPDDERAFHAANTAYRAILAIESALSLRWLGVLKAWRRASQESSRPVPISGKGTL